MKTEITYRTFAGITVKNAAGETMSFEPKTLDTMKEITVYFGDMSDHAMIHILCDLNDADRWFAEAEKAVKKALKGIVHSDIGGDLEITRKAVEQYKKFVKRGESPALAKVTDRYHELNAKVKNYASALIAAMEDLDDYENAKYYVAHSAKLAELIHKRDEAVEMIRFIGTIKNNHKTKGCA